MSKRKLSGKKHARKRDPNEDEIEDWMSGSFTTIVGKDDDFYDEFSGIFDEDYDDESLEQWDDDDYILMGDDDLGEDEEDY